MNCCQVEGIEEIMDEKTAEQELEEYRKAGASRTTRMLLDALQAEGVAGRTLLDIGGGVGAIQHELLKAGAVKAVSVDASSAYLRAARREAESEGHASRIAQHHGDFVEISDALAPADIVTLDRVICCYDDMPELVGRSAKLASRLYGVVYPKYRWYFRVVGWLGNLYLRLRGSQFRAFLHPKAAIETIINRAGFQRVFDAGTFIWHVQLYARQSM